MSGTSLTSPAGLEMIIFWAGNMSVVDAANYLLQVGWGGREGALLLHVAEVFLWASGIHYATRGCATIWVRHGLATGQAILESVFFLPEFFYLSLY